MIPRNANLLRYRFGDLQQMQNHLHVRERRTLFFWRDAKPALRDDDLVVVEFSLSNSEQVSIARGLVAARATGLDAAEGATSGLWLEFPDSRLAKRIAQGASAIAGRMQKRIGCDLVIEVRLGRQPVMARLLDVSLMGGRITGVPNMQPGFEVELRLISPGAGWPTDLGRAKVIRADGGGEIGIRFLRNDAASRIASAKLVQLAQQSWADAPELSHPPICCRDGRVLEPALPQVRFKLRS